MLTLIRRADEEPLASNPPEVGRLATFSALVVIATGLLVLLGWATGVGLLKQLHPGAVAVNPLTAICLVAAGSAIWLQRHGRRRPGRVLGLLVAVTALAKLVDLATGALPIDRLLFAGELSGLAGALPSRMAPNTAVSLLLLGLALMLSPGRSRAGHVAAERLAIAAMLVAAFALVGYLFGVGPLTAIGRFIPMAPQTGAALLFCGVGTVALGRDTTLIRIVCDHGPAGAMARTILPCAMLSPVVISVAWIWGETAGLFDRQSGAALAAVGNAYVNSMLLIVSILALYRSDRIRRKREKTLARSEHFNRKINQASPDAVSLLDADGNVLFSNDAALRAHGLADLSEMVGRPWAERLDEAGRADARAAIEAARRGDVGRLTTALAGPGGTPCWHESLISRIEDSDFEPITFLVMSRDITRQKEVEEQVRWSATHDPLTRLPNRALFQSCLDSLRTRPGEEQGESAGKACSALLVLDVDHFKLVNDTLGHDAGDVLLATVANRLRSSVRKQDFVARLGGDEFAIILRGIRSQSALDTAAAKLIEAMKEPWSYNDRLSDCRVSIGACIAQSPEEDSSELLKKADIALYAAKLQGGNRIAVFEPGMRAALQKRASEMALARDALQRDLVRPSYQPKVELKTGKLVGFEALLRWLHPTRGMQAPGLIGAAFEDVALAGALTDRMLDYLLRDMRGWIDSGVAFGHVAVNAAAADFKQKDFAERLLARLDRAGVPPELLQVEVTETVFLGRGAEYVERALKTLSARGVKIALDDFGTGYASLSHLKQFPVDIVKIDRSFLRDVNDQHNAAIIRTVVSLGRSLDLDVVAEGVETREQEAYLLAEGCRLGQGYRYGKAVPATRVPALVKAGPARVAIAA